jgi:tetratricopeptide (TPR) repeat protein
MIERALKLHPDSAPVHSTQAEFFLYMNDPEQALLAASKATKLDPTDPSAWMQLGRVHQGQLRLAQLKNERVDRQIRRDAIAAFERADELEEGSVLARVEQARLIAMRQKSSKEAKEVFISAVELAKEQGDAMAHFAAAQAAGDFAVRARRKAMQVWALREMVAADESRLDLWRRLADTIDETNGLGVVVYQELLEKRPDDVGAHVMFASYLVGRGHERDAMKYVREVVKHNLGSALPWEQLIRLQIQKGRIANARATYVEMSDEFPDDPVTQRTTARIALAEGRSADAVKILRRLAAESESFDLLRLLALAEYRNGDLADAADSINRALAINRVFTPETMRLKARIHHDSEDWAATLRALTALGVRGQTLTPSEMMMRARALYGIDRAETARGVLEQVLSGDAPPAMAAVEYARREGHTHPKEAAAFLAAALARTPANPEILETLVGIDLRAGQGKLALARINAAINTGRAKPKTLLLRAHVLYMGSKLDLAEADALRAFEADPSLAGGVDLLYAIYEAQDRLDEARTSFEEAEAAGVLHSGARLLLARIYLRQGETKRAQMMLEQILRDDPKTTGAKNDLASLLAQNEADLDRALQLAEEAQQSMSADPGAADTLGYVYFQKGLHEAALEQFLTAVELSREQPNVRAPTLHYHLGLTLDALNRNEEAKDAFRKALGIDANFPEAEDARSRLEQAREQKAAGASTS